MSQTDCGKVLAEEKGREELKIHSSLSTHMVMSHRSEDFKSESFQISLEPKVSKSTTASLSKTKNHSSYSQTLIASAEIECQTIEKEVCESEVQTIILSCDGESQTIPAEVGSDIGT